MSPGPEASGWEAEGDVLFVTSRRAFTFWAHVSHFNTFSEKDSLSPDGASR